MDAALLFDQPAGKENGSAFARFCGSKGRSTQPYADMVHKQLLRRKAPQDRLRSDMLCNAEEEAGITPQILAPAQINARCRPAAKGLVLAGHIVSMQRGDERQAHSPRDR